MIDPMIRRVAIEHAEDIATRIAALIREEFPDMRPREHIGVAAAALATSATMLDGTDDEIGQIKMGGVADTLAHCCRRWRLR